MGDWARQPHSGCVRACVCACSASILFFFLLLLRFRCMSFLQFFPTWVNFSVRLNSNPIHYMKNILDAARKKLIVYNTNSSTPLPKIAPNYRRFFFLSLEHSIPIIILFILVALFCGNSVHFLIIISNVIQKYSLRFTGSFSLKNSRKSQIWSRSKFWKKKPKHHYGQPYIFTYCVNNVMFFFRKICKSRWKKNNLINS